MYEIHSTEAIIIRVVPSGEADHFVSFYTKEHGRLNAKVTSSRKNESKHRYHLTVGNVVMLSYVHGRQELRVTGLDTLLSVITTEHTLADRQLFGRVIVLFEKLVSGSEQDEKLFDLMYSFLEFFTTDWFDAEYKDFVGELELVVTLQLLAELGYFDPQTFNLARLDGVEAYALDNLRKIQVHRVAVVAAANKTLSELQF